MTLDQTNVWATVSTGAGEDVFQLTEMWGDEYVSQPYRYELELLSSDSDVDFEQVLGKPGSVTLTYAGERKRHFHGIVTMLRQGPTDRGGTRYHAELRPWFWLLTQVSDCQIFQEKTTPEILSKVFNDLGFSDFRNSLNGTYALRDYCVQYRETAFDFVSRLMEDDGIFYYFDHTASDHTMVLGDDAAVHSDCSGVSDVRYQEGGSAAQEVDVVSECHLERQVTTGSYALNDFFFENPATALLANVTGEGDLARYDYPGGFQTKADGEKRAKVRLGAHEAQGVRLDGTSFCPSFGAGCVFSLSKHPRGDVNRSHVLVAVTHHLTQDAYSNSFSAIPDDTTFRPLPETPRPVIAGTQTAIVAGKTGEEIWTDKFGRIKVLFHWDRDGTGDERSSCWIRVAQGWAGKQWGAFFLPRVGQEVVVSFLEGDPDRPLVTGSVYNATQTVPYALPANQTRATVKSNTSKGGNGFNEIRFEDKKDAEEFYLHAQKDMKTEVLNDQTTLVTKNRMITVSEGDETHAVSKGKRTLSVKGDEQHANEANFTHEVKGDFKLKVTGAIQIEAGGDVTIKAGGAVTVKAAKALTNEAGQALTNKAGTALTNKAGTSLKNEAGTSLTNKAGTSLTNDAGVSLTNKASASQKVDGGGMLTLKGGMVKIN